jgi:hypothetical protein
MSKPHVLIFQTDNRTDVDYVCLSGLLNTRTVQYIGANPEYFSDFTYSYQNLVMQPSYYSDLGIHPACGKITVIEELLRFTNADILVFLDGDAWIQNCYHLHDTIKYMLSEDKQGVYSRDPYVSKNTYINSGSFILRVNDYTRTMYSEIKTVLFENSNFQNTWPYDQHYIGQKIYDNKSDFVVFIPDMTNTPCGLVLRHNWYKDQRLFADMYHLLDVNIPWSEPVEKIDFGSKLDDKPWPNPDEQGYEYL